MLDRCTSYFQLQLRRRAAACAVTAPVAASTPIRSTADGLAYIDLTLDSPEVRLNDYETFKVRILGCQIILKQYLCFFLV